MQRKHELQKKKDKQKLMDWERKHESRKQKAKQKLID